jgi:Ca-activated chloride channel family protein
MNLPVASLFGFDFGQPWWLLLLLGIYPLMRLRRKGGPVPAVTFSSHRLLAEVGRQTRSRPGRWRAGLRVLGIVLVILSLARPRLEKSAGEEKSEGIDIMLILDASESMDSKDFDMGKEKVSRMEALYHVMGRFIKDRTRDRIGVIGFAEKPFLISPLTLDHSWMMDSLKSVKTSLGTAIGSAVDSAADLLVKNARGTRVAILVTDGLNTSGVDPVEAARTARKFGVRLYTVAVVSYGEMQTGSQIDGITLYQMARMTGGQFFQAANESALESIYDQIDQLERTQFKQAHLLSYRELFPWFAGAALLVLTLETILNHSRRMRLP